jgi:hypothetical protein
MYPFSYIVVGLAWLRDPESCAGGTVATGRAFRVGQVRGDDPNKKGYPGPLSLGLDMGLMMIPPQFNSIYFVFIRSKRGL